MTFAGLTPYILMATVFPIAAVLLAVCACIWRALHPILSAPVPPPIPAEDQKDHHTAELMV